MSEPRTSCEKCGRTWRAFSEYFCGTVTCVPADRMCVECNNGWRRAGTTRCVLCLARHGARALEGK